MKVYESRTLVLLYRRGASKLPGGLNKMHSVDFSCLVAKISLSFERLIAE